MAPLALRYLTRDVDRHGNTRWYVRLPGRQKVRLRAKLNEDGTASAAFMEEYWRAARGEVANPRRAARVNEESFQAALYVYYASSEFAGHHEATQKAKRSVLDRYAVQAGPVRPSIFTYRFINDSHGIRKCLILSSWGNHLDAQLRFQIDLAINFLF